MHTRLTPLAALAALAFGLTACAAQPTEPDWPALTEQAEAFLSDGSDSAPMLGGVSVRVTPESQDTDLEDAAPSTSGMGITHPSPMHLENVEAACFGDGEVLLTVYIETASEGQLPETLTFPCDSTAHEVPLSRAYPEVDAVRVDADLSKGAGGVVSARLLGAENE